MSKSKKEIQRELYHFIGDLDEPVIQQVIFDRFCKKYNCSTRTISRYLEEMCQSRNPFHLRTWYDKNRYYEVPTLTRVWTFVSAASVAVPMVLFFVELYDVLHAHWYVFVSSSSFVVGFWIAMWIAAVRREKRQTVTKKFRKT